MSRQEGGSSNSPGPSPMAIETRGYQLEMLQESIHSNIIIAMDTGSGKTHIAVLRTRHEIESELKKITWFLAPTVALCDQQRSVLQTALPVTVGLISGALEPDQWKDAALWQKTLATHRVLVSTPQVLLDALRHAYVSVGRDISLIIFDEAHHAVDNHPYNRIMQEFYFDCPRRSAYGIRHRSGDFVRPMILGLTASPIFGGNVDRAFQMIESNLDCIIRTPRLHRSELEKYVHRPDFRHILYSYAQSPSSRNIAALSRVIETININEDPYIQSLREQLSKLRPHTSDYIRIDQKLSKSLNKEDTFTHKGLKDFHRTAYVILSEVGTWGADWYVWEVLQQAKAAAGPLQHMMRSWQTREKVYLLSIINRVQAVPVQYHPDDVSDKVVALIECLMTEKGEAEAANETFSGLIFVQRRDVVLALAELLRRHPVTKDLFQVGSLLGNSDSSQRHSFLDITRKIQKQNQDDTLMDFKIGEKNLIISTSVAEEGIDVQACGCVIRWDPPPNMASWAQSRGRARKQRSTFTIMFEEGNSNHTSVQKWMKLEQEMVAKYNDPLRNLLNSVDESLDFGDFGDGPQFRVDSTGALLTLQSAIPHLNHFCAVMPQQGHSNNVPLYDLTPTEYPIGWHSSKLTDQMPHPGPWGSTVTLPRALPSELRTFSTDVIHPSKASAHAHAAFKAYKALYDAGLLSDNLLPLFDTPDSAEVEEMKKEIEKRTGFASVSSQMNPWLPSTVKEMVCTAEYWYLSELTIGDLPPLHMFTQSYISLWTLDDGPTIYHPSLENMKVLISPLGQVDSSNLCLEEAKEWTRMLFWSINGSRMKPWDKTDFSYLFLPASRKRNPEWQRRQEWLDAYNKASSKPPSPDDYLNANSRKLGEHFRYPDDLAIIRDGFRFGKAYEFVRWRWEALTDEEQQELRERYSREPELILSYPVLEVRAFHPRTNFLVPRTGKATPTATKILLPYLSATVLLSKTETLYAFLLPSVIRAIAMNITVNSLRSNLFTDQSLLSTIPNEILTVALTAPVSQERLNYQRLETLGDTVLKYVMAIQLLAEYPHWPEGYLTKRKDHAVSNVRLAKENLQRTVYRWIIRDRMIGKKWAPEYLSPAPKPADNSGPASDDGGQKSNKEPNSAKEVTQIPNGEPSVAKEDNLIPDGQPTETEKVPMEVEVVKTNEIVDGQSKTKKKKKKKSKKKSTNSQELSTKVLADVVESLIGAAYLHGGFDFGYECVKLFHLGFDSWLPLPDRIASTLSRVDKTWNSLSSSSSIEIPPQIGYVERMLRYTFVRPLLLVEALTHPSHQQDYGTVSYERMEFLGDSVLDMVVNDYLYRAPGKNYSPGHMHLRKSASVNAHILAYICLSTSFTLEAQIPRPEVLEEQLAPRRGAVKVTLEDDSQTHHLWQCLMHTSTRVSEDQTFAFARYKKRGEEIAEQLKTGSIFPWASLTRLQAPKFLSDMIESILGAVFLDSEGNLDVVREVMRVLGLYQILERIVKDDIDVLHPVSRLSLWASKNEKEVEYNFKEEKGRISCGILLNGEELEGSRVSDVAQGKATKEEVKFAASEAAIGILHLRDVGAKYVKVKARKKGKERTED